MNEYWKTLGPMGWTVAIVIGGFWFAFGAVIGSQCAYKILLGINFI